ncbi:MAG TPA: hypothetical protein VJM81_08830 [Rhizorhapis sp.]|nr:hypothetical protein [Rhizorhapis sp.]
MTIRTTCTTVTFIAPFQLPGFTEPLSAGPYEVETDEEMLEGNGHTAYHRVGTTLRVEKGSVIEHHPIDPAHLAAALERDQRARSTALPLAPVTKQAVTSVAARPSRARWVSLWVRNAPPSGSR